MPPVPGIHPILLLVLEVESEAFDRLLLAGGGELGLLDGHDLSAGAPSAHDPNSDLLTFLEEALKDSKPTCEAEIVGREVAITACGETHKISHRHHVFYYSLHRVGVSLHQQLVRVKIQLCDLLLYVKLRHIRVSLR